MFRSSVIHYFSTNITPTIIFLVLIGPLEVASAVGIPAPNNNKTTIPAKALQLSATVKQNGTTAKIVTAMKSANINANAANSTAAANQGNFLNIATNKADKAVDLNNGLSLLDGNANITKLAQKTIKTPTTQKIMPTQNGTASIETMTTLANNNGNATANNNNNSTKLTTAVSTNKMANKKKNAVAKNNSNAEDNNDEYPEAKIKENKKAQSKSMEIDDEDVEDDEMPTKMRKQNAGKSKQPAAKEQGKSDMHGFIANSEQEPHVFRYLLLLFVSMGVLYVIAHNRKKIMGCVLEGGRSKGRAEPRYRRLSQCEHGASSSSNVKTGAINVGGSS